MNEAARQNISLDAAVDDVESRFIAANSASQARHERAKRSMPGANTRTTLHYDPFPVALVGGEGAWVKDLDGHRYRDLLGEYTAGLYGHSEPAIISALHEALDSGLVLGGPNEYEAQLAELMCARFPAVDLVRFCNSGTEANMMCLSLARAVTARPRVLTFHGAYHGGLFSFAGGQASAMNAAGDVVLCDYNDADTAAALIRDNADALAAVILEPMMGSAGCIPAEAGFLAALREGCDRTGALLIYDEVMTSRLAPGGMQERAGVRPDLVAFGKYLGGGVSFGAFGGRHDLMSHLDPSRPDALVHSGTFNNNVLTMAAGLAGLSKVLTPDAAIRLNASGDRLRERLQATADALDVPARIMGIGSMLCIHLQAEPIRRPADTNATPAAKRKLLHLEMLLRGFYIARRGFMSLSLALRDEDYDAFVEAFGSTLEEHRSVLG
jgi:glutamate-1-semialdehyde 2,1-aminomutase